ncbi:hypothetical protein WJX72_000981 [[Myrmecia] bisecta]|uniref:Glycosyltransferase 61 catalytic domain-containing protein n=1 Tax=[Myrmecia] bisecta TaxID=41462 RepID=A0AAW1QE28_9CHLO
MPTLQSVHRRSFGGSWLPRRSEFLALLGVALVLTALVVFYPRFSALQQLPTTSNPQQEQQQLRDPGDISTVRCRKMQDRHMTEASAPHVLCDATNLLVDTSKMRLAKCPAQRPNYLCISKSYHRYKLGAFGASCNWPVLNLNDFPKDHLQDIMESLESYPADQWPQAGAISDTPVLLVTREFKEHTNVFHTLTDILNVYISLRMLGWLGLKRQVVLLDAHPDGPLDGLWAAVAAGGGLDAIAYPWHSKNTDGRPLLARVDALPQQITLFRKAIFVPPGYTSLLYAHLYQDNSCPHATPLFAGFRRFVMEPLGLYNLRPDVKAPIKILLISRKPYEGKGKVVRRIGNEDELVDMLAGMAHVSAELVDLASLSLLEQLSTLADADILIGMHGAALAYTLLMPPHAGVIELWAQDKGIWRCYEHTSAWAGLEYRRWQNTDPTRTRVDAAGSDITTVDVSAVRLLAEELISAVRQRKASQHAL